MIHQKQKDNILKISPNLFLQKFLSILRNSDWFTQPLHTWLSTEETHRETTTMSTHCRHQVDFKTKQPVDFNSDGHHTHLTPKLVVDSKISRQLNNQSTAPPLLAADLPHNNYNFNTIGIQTLNEFNSP